ncbi:hypothetical protein PCE1_000989 [Barthelona sp. PCE]
MRFLILIVCVLAIVASEEYVMDLSFVHTTDDHGWLDGHRHNSFAPSGFGAAVSFADHLRTSRHENDKDFLLVDTGDFVQGTGLSDITDPIGKLILEAADMADYDLMTIGNHELGTDSTMEYIRDKWSFPATGKYVTTNAFFTNGRVRHIGSPYREFTLPKSGKKVLALGFLNPVSHMASYLRTDDVIETLMNNNEVKSRVQAKDFDLLILLCHIGSSSSTIHNLEMKIREWWRETDAADNSPMVIFTGHTHRTNFTHFDDRNTVVLESGCYLYSVGYLNIKLTADGTLKTYHTFFSSDQKRFEDFLAHEGVRYQNFTTERGKEINAFVTRWTKYYDLDKVLACSDKRYYRRHYITEEDSLFNLVMNKIFPSTVLNVPIDYQDLNNYPVYFMNTGSLRSDIFPGTVDLDDLFTLDPFNTSIHYIPGLTEEEIRATFDRMNNYRNGVWETLDSIIEKRQGHNTLPNSNIPHFYRSSIVKGKPMYAIVGSDYDTTRALDILRDDYSDRTWNQFRLVEKSIRNIVADYFASSSSFQCEDPNPTHPYHRSPIIIVLVCIVVVGALVGVVMIFFRRRPTRISRHSMSYGVGLGNVETLRPTMSPPVDTQNLLSNNVYDAYDDESYSV